MHLSRVRRDPTLDSISGGFAVEVQETNVIVYKSKSRAQHRMTRNLDQVTLDRLGETIFPETGSRDHSRCESFVHSPLADGPTEKMLHCGSVEDVFATVDFGAPQTEGSMKKHFGLQRKYAGGGQSQA